jgi:DNA-binding NarL/FixJ family response regulator
VLTPVPFGCFRPRWREGRFVILKKKFGAGLGGPDRIAGFRTGVGAYITKPFEPEGLTAVVKSILDRVQRTHADLARMFGEQEADEGEPVRDEDLTDAEWRVAEAVARGLSNKEIAAELNLSLRTVEGHISRILDKKSLSNRVELALHIRERKQPG